MNKSIFFIKDYNYINSQDLIDIENIPPIVRRRLSFLDRAALTTLGKIENYEGIKEIIFSSKIGELTRLEDLISQYIELNEVSPNQFSASVHNYVSGFFTLMNKLNIPYQAVSSAENSLSSGLVMAILASRTPVLYCFANAAEGTTALSCVISNEEIQGGIKCSFSKNTDNEDFSECEFEDFVKFLDGKIDKFVTVYGTLERIV